MENMMSMAVYLVIADTLDIDVDAIYPDSNLKHDLGMTAAVQQELDQSIMEMFNNFQVDFSQADTVGDVVRQIAKVTIH
ncbi:hypothetical protein NP603_11765 [Methylomonas sp. SURF-1]|uniref:Carrier domain-containing protein n=1 Tax=Methylomonas aurea TaxID=2952224 RepID=A0ABT1UHS3_9GAMM|nr:hypothetical protein [Methylomonas sp. SURF-1]MCQ8181787.1 hypothetical protein [Methylomonas sp. SURF-1]